MVGCPSLDCKYDCEHPSPLDRGSETETITTPIQSLIQRSKENAVSRLSDNAAGTAFYLIFLNSEALKTSKTLQDDSYKSELTRDWIRESGRTNRAS